MIELGTVICRMLQSPILQVSIVGLWLVTAIAVVRATRQLRKNFANADTAGDPKLATDERLIEIEPLSELADAVWLPLLLVLLLGALTTIGVDLLSCLS